MIEKKNNRRENREVNTRQVFNLILNSEEGISRIDISKKTGLSASVITGIVDKLIATKLVIESGVIQKRESGRKAILLKTNSFGGFFASLLFCKGKIKLDVFDMERKLDASYQIPVSKSVITGDFLINCIEDAVQYNYKYGTFFGIILILPPWHSSAFGDERMKQEFGYSFDPEYKNRLHTFYKDIAIYLEPTTAMVAYSSLENRKESKNVLCIESGKEIFASFIIGGRLFDRRHCSEKLANSIINYNLIGSGKARLRDFASEFAIRSAYEEKTGKSISFNEIVSLYLKKDKIVQAGINEVAEIMAQCVAGLAELLELDTIIIGGEIAKLESDFIDAFYSKLIAIEPSLKTIEVKPCKDYMLATQGGAYFAFDHIFDE